MLLGVTVGLPYFALSSTGPLLQKWFHDALPGISPYRLFALSNLGSLVALISYPFFFEVQWGVATQAGYWSLAYLAFVGFCSACAVQAWQARRKVELAHKQPDVALATELKPAAETKPGWQKIGYWLGLASLASVMFLAFTNEVCQNVASVPLLWVVPLSLYLLSFIIAFDHSRWYSRSAFGWGVLLLSAVVVHYQFCVDQMDGVVNFIRGPSTDEAVSLDEFWWLQAACYFLTLFLIATMCHGELARSRPAPEHLTTFYLTMALGGAIGGLLVNLAAPYLFATFFEFPLGMMLTTLTAAGLAVAGAMQVSLKPARWVVIGAAVALSIVSINGLLIEQLPDNRRKYKTVSESRNFYGIVSVMHRAIGDPEENFTFFSGSISHGKQLADPARRRTPLTYYGEGSGCQKAIQYVQARRRIVALEWLA